MKRPEHQEIHLLGRVATSESKQRETTRRILTDWVKAYREAGMELPASIKVKCERAGVSIEAEP